MLADNPKSLHLYAVRRIGGELFAVGEQGLALKLDRDSGRFAAHDASLRRHPVRRWSARAGP